MVGLAGSIPVAPTIKSIACWRFAEAIWGSKRTEIVDR